MRKVEIDGHRLRTGEWRSSPYGRLSLSIARKKYHCQKCGKPIYPGDPVFRVMQFSFWGWSGEVACHKHFDLKILEKLQDEPI